MIKEIHPIDRSVNARVRVPGSKSITNRALICTALAEGESVIWNASDSDDTALMINGLNQLGVLVRRKDNTLIVQGTGGKLYAPKFPIPVGNAGTTLRFLLSVAALAQGKTTFEADQRMAERPITDLVDALHSLGVKAEVFGSRFIVYGEGLKGGSVTLSSSRSSQFLSSLLMTAPYASKDVTMQINGLVASAPYVDMTIEVMRAFGIHTHSSDHKSFTVLSHQRYQPVTFAVEPDASAASYFLAAAAIAGGEVLVEGVTMTSIQGDIGFVEVLKRIGCRMSEEKLGIRVSGPDKLLAVDVDMNAMPDVVPTLAVTALFADGTTRIRNVSHLRNKESDRLEALTTELRKLAASVTLLDDGLEISPAPLHGAQLDTYDDHRLAMSFALVGLRLAGVKIENPECVRKSFPGFWEEFEKLSFRS